MVISVKMECVHLGAVLWREVMDEQKKDAVHQQLLLDLGSERGTGRKECY